MKRRPIAAHLSVVVLLALAACATEPALVRQGRKEKLIAAIRTELLESVIAEKSAVLATTDEESQQLSVEVERFRTNVNRLRDELRPLVAADGRKSEIEHLDAFDAAWSRLAGVDRRLLALATANTNLHAVRLSTREGADALDRVVDALSELEQGSSDPDTIRTLARASVAALRTQSVLLVHIPTADGAEMTRLEKQIDDLDGEVQQDLARVQASLQPPPEQLGRAQKAWVEYHRISSEVLRLSRENTNVISFDVSIHEKRQVTQECLDALAALATAVDTSAPGAR